MALDLPLAASVPGAAGKPQESIFAWHGWIQLDRHVLEGGGNTAAGRRLTSIHMLCT